LGLGLGLGLGLVMLTLPYPSYLIFLAWKEKVPLMEYVGAAAGATLGYITNNIPGAYIGFNEGYRRGKLYQMAPITRSQTRKAALRKRVRSRVIAVRSKDSVKPLMKAYVDKGNGGPPKGNVESSKNARGVNVKNRFNKKVSFKKPKSVKISKDFRLKVSKALEPRNSHGKFQEVFYIRHLMGLSFGNKQCFERLYAGVYNNNSDSTLFTPIAVLNAASVLFNNKTASLTQATTSGINTTFSANTMDPRTAKVTVKNSFAQFTLRNNSRRTWIIQLYECSPKKMHNQIDEGDAYTQWGNCMINETNNPTDETQKKINLAGATPNTLYATPFQCAAFMKSWNVEKHDITMDPGQVYTHTVRGPSNTVYDFAKFWKADSSGSADQFFNTVPSKTRCVFFTARLDLCYSSTTNAVGRWGIPQYSSLDTETLISEWKQYFNISIPEQAGGGVNVDALGIKQFTLGQARNCYHLKNWFENSYSPLTRIDDEAVINTAN